MNNPNPRLQRGLLVVALVQGVLGDLLIKGGPDTLGLFLWALAGIGGIAALAYRESLALPRRTWFWLGAAGGIALLPSLRGAGLLIALSLLAGVGCLVLAAWSARGGNPFAAPASAFPIQAVVTAFHAAAGGLGWIASALTGAAPPVLPGAPAPRPPTRGWARAVVGVLAAVPVLVLFTSLFASADPIFAKGLRSVVEVDFSTLASHAFLFGFWAWISAGYGRRVLVSGVGDGLLQWVPASPRRAPATEVLTGLGLVAALFAVFVAVQVRYLFGDDALVQATVGMTYAEYARQGFFELLAVAFLLLPLLLGCDWLIGGATNRKGFQAVGGLLLALLGVVLASAWKRLALYTTAYGLTVPRLYATAVLVWLGLVTVWFAVVVLPGRRERFLGGGAVGALAALVALYALNPDALIARHNLARARDGLRWDVEHFLALGPDAVPVLVREMSVLPEEDRKKLREALAKRWQTPDTDWRHWNLARARAQAAVAAWSAK